MSFYFFILVTNQNSCTMKKIFFVLTIVTVAIFAACSKKNNPGKTPKEIPVTYTIDVSPLIQAKCTPCHLPSRGGKKANFETYESARTYGADMVTRIQLNPGERGFMPFKHEKLPAAEIVLFKKWVEQGMLEK